MFKLGVDDSAQLGKFAMKPYAIFAFEFGTDAGQGRRTAVSRPGKYLELGIAPGYAGSKAAIAVPIKIGMSMGDYYELGRRGQQVRLFQHRWYRHRAARRDDQVGRLERALRRRIPEAG